jgi:hypothetical protein
MGKHGSLDLRARSSKSSDGSVIIASLLVRRFKVGRREEGVGRSADKCPRCHPLGMSRYRPKIDVQISIPLPSSGSPPNSNPPSLLGISASASEVSSPAKSARGILGSPRGKKPTDDAQRDPMSDKIDELAALFVAFGFALQYVRPLPHAPG